MATDLPISKIINSIDEIFSQYDLWIFDIYGVVFNGDKIFDEGLEAVIKIIKNPEKEVCFLSNSPRPQEFIRQRMYSRTSNEEHKKFLSFIPIYTSGDFFIENFCKYILKIEHNEEKNYTPIPIKVYIMGDDKNHNLIQKIRERIIEMGINAEDYLENTDKISEANLVINVTFSEEGITDEIQKKFEKMIGLNITMLCPNPDITVANGNKKPLFTPGFFANHYFEMGGKVQYFGKPFPPIYHYTLSKIKEMKNKDIQKMRTICVGDSLIHDIAGGRGIGADTMLVGRFSQYDLISGEIKEKTTDQRWRDILGNEKDLKADYFIDELK